MTSPRKFATFGQFTRKLIESFEEAGAIWAPQICHGLRSVDEVGKYSILPRPRIFLSPPYLPSNRRRDRSSREVPRNDAAGRIEDHRRDLREDTASADARYRRQPGGPWVSGPSRSSVLGRSDNSSHRVRDERY